MLDIRNELRETGMDPGLLELGITEMTIMQNMKATIGILQELKQLGVRIGGSPPVPKAGVLPCCQTSWLCKSNHRQLGSTGRVSRQCGAHGGLAYAYLSSRVSHAPLVHQGVKGHEEIQIDAMKIHKTNNHIYKLSVGRIMPGPTNYLEEWFGLFFQLGQFPPQA